MKALLVTFSFFFALSSMAGSYATYKKLGFSSSGKYFAMVQSTIQDGSGFPHAKAFVVDVDSNTLVEYSNVVLQDDLATLQQAEEQAITKARVRQYLTIGQHMGSTKLLRLPTDQSQYATNSFSFDPIPGGAVGGIEFNVHIEEKPAPVESHNDFCMDEQNNMIRVTIDHTFGPTTHVLQDDQRQPSSRSCSFGYKLMEVIHYKAGLVYILKYQSYGFEGPDHNHMIITSNVDLF